MNGISNIITSANGNDKVIDFRDNLVIPIPEEYATIHQQSGKKGRDAGKIPSSIGIYICDYSRGKGEQSVTLKANIKPYLIDQWLWICRAASGTTVVPVGEKFPSTRFISELKETPKVVKKVASVALMALNIVHVVVEEVCKFFYGQRQFSSKMDMISEFAFNIQNSKVAACTEWNNVEQERQQMANEMPSIFIPNHRDYSYSQQRVNTYKSLDGGYCPVTILNVKRQSVDKNNELRKYPWYFEISSFEARPVTKANGTINYDPNSIRNKKMVQINVSDENMYEMMRTCQDTIDTFKIASAYAYLNGKNAYLNQTDRERGGNNGNVF